MGDGRDSLGRVYHGKIKGGTPEETSQFIAALRTIFKDPAHFRKKRIHKKLKPASSKKPSKTEPKPVAKKAAEETKPAPQNAEDRPGTLPGKSVSTDEPVVSLNSRRKS